MELIHLRKYVKFGHLILSLKLNLRVTLNIQYEIRGDMKQLKDIDDQSESNNKTFCLRTLIRHNSNLKT